MNTGRVIAHCGGGPVALHRMLCGATCGPPPSFPGPHLDSASLRVQVLGGYRRLMRARAKLFAGDDFALAQSRTKLKEEFLAKAGVSDAAKVTEHIDEITDVESFMRHNLAQGVLNERGSFEVKLTAEHNERRDADGKLEINHVDNKSGGVGPPSMVEHSSATGRAGPDQ